MTGGGRRFDRTHRPGQRGEDTRPPQRRNNDRPASTPQRDRPPLRRDPRPAPGPAIPRIAVLIAIATIGWSCRAVVPLTFRATGRLLVATVGTWLA